MKKKLKAKAHIPTQSYGYLEIKGSTDDLEQIEEIYNRYAESPIKFSNGVFKEVKAFTGETILYNTKTHSYTDLEGNILIGGSTYKKSLEKPFDVELLSKKIAEKYGLDQQLVKNMWSHNSRTSRSFGDAIHNAMEQWFKFRGFEKQLEDKDYHLPNHKWLRGMVLDFPLREANILPEVLVSDVKNGRAGQIDGLEIVDKEKKVANVHDWKSDGKIEKNVKGHFNQLSFYAHILIAFGWKIEKVVVWNYLDEWKSFESEVLELK